MGEALRFFVFLYPILGPEGGEKGGGERKRLVEKKKGIPSMVANGMTGQRESRRRCSRGEGKEGGGEKRSAQRMG